jgi:hypothetical protein
MLIVAITGHWIDRNFRLHEALLSFDELKGEHDGENIAETVYSVLDNYNITEKLFCVTTDNASNNGNCVKFLRKLLSQNKGIEWNEEEHHIRCLNHVINIAVQAFLKKCKVLSTDGVEEDANRDDVDSDFGDEELRAAEEQARDPTIRREIKEAANGFQTTMLKLREIGKVHFTFSCSAQIKIINC